jgi:hypothetical protein
MGCLTLKKNRKKGIPVTTGRGSKAGAAIAQVIEHYGYCKRDSQPKIY